MKTIISLCINLVILIISDASAVKLVAGDRKIVKRNGTTHTISKYYVVPNDFDPNNVTNSNTVEVSRKKTLRMNSNHYFKSKESEAKAAINKNNENNGQVRHNDFASNHTIENIKIVVNDTVDSFSSGQNDVQVQADDNTSESTKSASTELNFDTDNIGTHLRVEPLIKPINISGNVTGNIYNLLQSRRLIDIETETNENHSDEEQNNLSLTNFAIAVHDKSLQNVDDFWKLVRFNMDATFDDNELMVKIERLSQLLNIFTILYEAAKSQKPFESMIDSIINILQIPIVIKSNTNDTVSKTYVSGDYDDDCLRKCQQKLFKPQVDSNGTYLTGLEGRMPNNNLAQENLILLTRLTGNSNNGHDLISPYNSQNLLEVSDTQEDRGSNQALPVSSEMDTDLNDLLITTESRVTDKQPVTSETKIIKKWVVDNSAPETTVIKWVVEDKSSNSGETIQRVVEDESPNLVTDNQLLITKSRVAKPWVSVDRSIESLPSTVADLRTADLPLLITETKVTKPWVSVDRSIESLPSTVANLRTADLPLLITESRVPKPWVSVDRSIESLPSTDASLRTADLPWRFENKAIENVPGYSGDKTTYHLPWHIEDRNKDKLPWHIENKKTKHLPWHIKDKISNHQPWTDKDKTNLPWIIEDRSPVKVTWNHVNNNFRDPRVKTHNDKNLIGPQQPSTVHWIKNRVKKPYHIYTYVIKPDTRLYETPNLGKIGMADYTKHTKYVTPTYDTDNTVNAIYQLPDTPQDNYQREYPVGAENKTNHKPEPETNSNEDNGETTVSEEVNPHSAVILPNVLSNPSQSLYPDRYGPLFTSNTSAENPDVVKAESNSNNTNINLNFIQHTNILPSLVSKVLSQPEYTLPDDNTGIVSGAHQPGFITETSAQSEVTVSNDYNNPAADNSEYINQRPDFIPIVVNEYGKPSKVFSQSTPQHPGFITTTHSEFTNIPNDYSEPTDDYSEDIDQRPDLVPMIPKHPEYTNIYNDYEEPTPIHSKNPLQHSGYTTQTTAHSEFTTTNDYNNPTAASSEEIYQHPDYIPMVPYHPEYTNVVDDYEKPNVYSQNTPQHPSYTIKNSTHSEFTVSKDYQNPTADSSEEIDQNLGYIPKVPYHPEYTNVVDDYEKPNVYSQNTPQHPSYTIKNSTHSEFTVSKDYQNPTADSSEEIDQNLGYIPKVPYHPEYTNVVNSYEEPSNVYSQNTPQHPGYTTKTLTHSELTVSKDFMNPTAANSEEIDQHRGYIPMVPYHPKYTSTEDNHKVLNPVNDDFLPYHPKHLKVNDNDDKPFTENLLQHPGYVVKAHSEVSVTNDYNNPIPGHEHAIYTHPDMIQNVPNSLEHINAHDAYDKPIPVYKDDTVLHPGWKVPSPSEHKKSPYYNNNPRPYHEKDISTHPGLVHHVFNTPEVYDEETVQHPGWKATSHSKYIDLPNHYSNYDEDIDTRPESTDILNDYTAQPTFVNDASTEISNNPLTHQHYEHTVDTSKPSYVAYLHGKRPTKHNQLKNMKLIMAPTYKLLTLDNLKKLYDAVTKTIGISKTDNIDYRAMINLRKVINIILILAEELNEPDDRHKWYMKIFYNAEKNPHPLQLYVYNLIRQRWLHELMLVLWKNNFDIHILQNPSMFSFLRSWQFPNYVQSFLEPEDLKYHDFDFTENSKLSLPDQFYTQTYDDLLEEVPEDLENYVTNKVIESYKAPNDGIVVSIAGVEVEPDANAIINILQNYLHFKNYEQNVIIRDNKVEMLKQIILFLAQKGYSPKTIAELVYKLNSSVDLTEGKECHPHHSNFANNMYKVVLPVLRRSVW